MSTRSGVALDRHPKSFNRIVIGTAGHIDHGKTRLLTALTGIDCDRWAEEKARGITIDLGFAHLFEGDLQIGFIDVPGHRRFLDNALAGLGGIRVMLLVIAATEGVMPQTREHLAICSLLGIPTAVVALTKIDLCDPELVELATLDVQELLADTPFADAPILPVSAVTGDGLEALRRTLIDVARSNVVESDDRNPPRLPIDRAFHLKGLGVVVTGTLASGTIRPGDTLQAAPTNLEARVRNIHVHGNAREAAERGERTSLQLAGVSLDAVQRGLQLIRPDSYGRADVLMARVTLLPESPIPLDSATEVRFHLFASETIGRIRALDPKRLEPGQTGLVEIRLRDSVVAVRGDRFIVRRPTPAATLGGGEILDPAWPRRRKEQLADDLRRLSGSTTDAIELWIERQGARGASAALLAQKTGLSPTQTEEVEIASLRSAGKIREVPASQGSSARWLAETVVERLTQRAKTILEKHFRRHRLAASMPKAEWVRRLLPAVPAPVVLAILGWLTEAEIIEVDGGAIRLPGHEVTLSPDEHSLVQPLTARLEQAGLSPPSLEELRATLGADARVFNQTSRFLIESGILVRLPNQEVVAFSAFESVRQELLGNDWERFNVAQFKDHFKLTRKWAIPLLEHCDSVGITKRIGNERLVVR